MFQLGFYEFVLIFFLGSILLNKKDFVYCCFFIGKLFKTLKDQTATIRQEIQDIWQTVEVEQFARAAKNKAAKKERLIKNQPKTDDS